VRSPERGAAPIAVRRFLSANGVFLSPDEVFLSLPDVFLPPDEVFLSLSGVFLPPDDGFLSPFPFGVGDAASGDGV